MKNDWDWKQQISVSSWHSLSYDNWPGWDKGVEGHTLQAELVIKYGEGKSGYKIAVEVDDWCRGQFYYRDLTKSGLPILDQGERYITVFYFQLTADYLRFTSDYPQVLGADTLKLRMEWA